MQTIEELLAEWDTPEERERMARSHAEYNAKPCKYDSVGECYVHGYFPPRPCGHTCFDVPCVTCSPEKPNGPGIPQSR
jgi:hypothetical protein